VIPTAWTQTFTRELTEVYNVPDYVVQRCMRCTFPWNLISLRRLELMFVGSSATGLGANAWGGVGQGARDLPLSEVLPIVATMREVMCWHQQMTAQDMEAFAKVLVKPVFKRKDAKSLIPVFAKLFKYEGKGMVPVACGGWVAGGG
jgi:hypothetical protein